VIDLILQWIGLVSVLVALVAMFATARLFFSILRLACARSKGAKGRSGGGGRWRPMDGKWELYSGGNKEHQYCRLNRNAREDCSRCCIQLDSQGCQDICANYRF